MKELYTTPEIEVIEFDTDIVVANSGDSDENDIKRKDEIEP